MFVAITVAVILFAISSLHFLWAAGSPWPCADERSLIRTVVGHPETKGFPSPALTAAVATAILLAGLIALWAGNVVSPPLPDWIRIAGLVVLTGVFLLRGFASYLPRRLWGEMTEPFATLDRRYFAPLCIVLGLGFLWLLAGNLPN
ncbi:DUF3995 domain-containing protein [Hoeflea prorocentri]|uniref:DUF3995 domain-containing protein n=1 Tax=Hoeflea prorocentri TaxID=1922333 RepID=A0A9X3UM10_9HYPH|nr:DUF3995 domain-containing protein [Hoeflea prorocentri]MCY6383079.1 DUF3995 domain-containing protein [Hoeflea prorocentri]MDA5400879.1 DUF3995 domain-containing protein [Hoeflea prorocentri]